MSERTDHVTCDTCHQLTLFSIYGTEECSYRCNGDVFRRQCEYWANLAQCYSVLFITYHPPIINNHHRHRCYSLYRKLTQDFLQTHLRVLKSSRVAWLVGLFTGNTQMAIDEEALHHLELQPSRSPIGADARNISSEQLRDFPVVPPPNSTNFRSSAKMADTNSKKKPPRLLHPWVPVISRRHLVFQERDHKNVFQTKKI